MIEYMFANDKMSEISLRMNNESPLLIDWIMKSILNDDYNYNLI